jgi:transcription initiation factor IIE alpha subunit
MFNKKKIEELEKRIERLENIIQENERKEIEKPNYFNNNKGV